MPKISLYIIVAFLVLLFFPSLFAESRNADFDIYVCYAKYIDGESPFILSDKKELEGNNYIPLSIVKNISNLDNNIFFSLLTSAYEKDDNDPFDDVSLYFIFWDKLKNKGLLLEMSLKNENKLKFYFPLNIIKKDNLFYAFDKENESVYITKNKFVYDELKKVLKTIPFKKVKKTLKDNNFDIETLAMNKIFQ